MENLTYLCVFVKIFAKKLPLHDVQPLKQQLHLTFSFSYMPHIDFFDITLSQMAGECKTRREMAFTDIRLRKRDRRPQILAIPSVLLYNKLHGTKKPYPAHRCGTRNPFHPVFRLLAFLLRRRNRKGRHHTPCKIRGLRGGSRRQHGESADPGSLHVPGCAWLRLHRLCLERGRRRPDPLRQDRVHSSRFSPKSSPGRTNASSF